MTDKSARVTSLKLTEEDRRAIEKAKKILAPKGMRVSLADALRAALHFYVEQKEADKSGNTPAPK